MVLYDHQKNKKPKEKNYIEEVRKQGGISFIAHPDEKQFNQVLPANSAVLKAIKNRATDTQEMENGQEIHKTIAPVGDIGWYIVLAINENEILEPVDYTRFFTIAFGVVIEILIFLIFVIFILFRVI